MFAERKWKRANVFSWGCNQLCDCWSQKRTFGRTVWMLVHRSIPRAIGCDTWIEKNWTKKKWIETMVYSWIIYPTHYSPPPPKKNTFGTFFVWKKNCGFYQVFSGGFYRPPRPSDMMVTETNAMKKTMMGHSPGFPAVTALITSALAPKTAGNNLREVRLKTNPGKRVDRKSPVGLGPIGSTGLVYLPTFGWF